MIDKGRLIVIRARFPLDITEEAIDRIIASLGALFDGKKKIEVYRQIGLPRDIQWLIYPDEDSLSDRDAESDRLIAALSENCSLDKTVWKIAQKTYEERK